MTWRSKYFTLSELTHSDTAVRKAIANIPPPEIEARLEETAYRMDAVRDLLGQPIHVNSGYRGHDLNRLIGGVDTSAHTLGYAVDFVCPAYGGPLHVAERIRGAGVRFDQLIYEGTWVHISFDPRMRQQCLTARFRPGKTSYDPGLKA